MRLRGFLACTAVMSLGLADINAAPPPEMDLALAELACLEPASAMATKASAPLPPAPSPLIEEDKVFGQAYYDTLGILSEDNECTDFFGGTTGAVMVFNSFMGQVRKEYLPPTIGMRMSGDVTLGISVKTKTKYRLFDKVSVNTNGPFYRRTFSQSEVSIPRLGNFEPNTKEVRVLILLHELGHLMKRNDGNWLLADDSKADTISRDNSKKILEVCGEQIKALGRPSSN
ncbi:MAG TPA: hypothetical protein VEW46_03940 [Pyrinomonadaceae bacterium]|nr:hypothetical protein [Pyrinomonadaceae bacterium]